MSGMYPQFPLTLAACRKHESAQWAIGDALVKECGAPSGNGVNTGSTAVLESARAYLMTHGFEYATETLRSYRTVAAAFPAGTRRAAFNVCRAAKDPATLAAIIKDKPEGQHLTVDYVAEIVRRAAFAADAAREQVWRDRMAAKAASDLTDQQAEIWPTPVERPLTPDIRITGDMKGPPDPLPTVSPGLSAAFQLRTQLHICPLIWNSRLAS